ncbi:MAG TPA: T9SS type A sorting domain-containing protein [Candidatus Edwardsbacteria bacterium]|nr:T9SS type A sorting domain-containing protein [Candidatus Edwardsbacteria bacterium]
MKRTLCALLILTLVIAVPALAVKHQPINKYGFDDNSRAAALKQANPSLRSTKAITSVTIDTCVNIRAILGTNCRSIGSNVGTTSDTVQTVYLRGQAGTYALWHAYSLDGGATWTKYNVVAADANNRPRYPAMEIAANDEGNSAFQCARIAYHLQATDPRLKLAYESSSLGDNAWSFVEISDGSTDFWTPCLTQRGNELAVAGQDYNGGGVGIAASTDGGATWLPSPIPLVDSFATPGTQAALVWLNDTTLMGFVPEPRYDSQGAMSYLISYDKGVTWTGPKSIWPTPDGYSPQFRGSTWWYDYDAMVINGVPYVAFANSDFTTYGGRGYSGQSIFVAHPTTPGDYTQWTIKHVSDMWDTATSNGFYPTEPALGADAAGNIYLSYVPWGSSNLSTDAAVIRSTDGGNTWTTPLHFMNAGKVNLDPFEISRTVGSYVYGVGCDSISGSAKYPLASYKIPVADIAAQPVISDADRYMPPSQPLTGAAWHGDTLTDTATVTANTIEWAWQPGFGFGGHYELTISQTADWSGTNYDLNQHPDSNDLFIDGMPATGRWFYKVRSIRPNASTTAWSGIYTFTYLGTDINTTDWVASGVAGKPAAPVYSFAVRAAYPNPAKDRATISYQLPKAGAVSLKVYNIAGQAVKSMDVHGSAGMNTMTLSTKDMANGVYFYQVNSNGLSATRKLTVVR